MTAYGTTRKKMLLCGGVVIAMLFGCAAAFADSSSIAFAPNRVLVKLSGSDQQVAGAGLPQTFESLTQGVLRSSQNLHGLRSSELFPSAAPHAVAGGLPQVASGPGQWAMIEYEGGENPEALCRELSSAAEGSVVSCEPDYIVTLSALPDDTYADPDDNGSWSTGAWGQSFFDMWGLQQVRAVEAWSAPGCANNCSGEGVVVAVVDSGLDITHPDIAGRLWTNAAEIAGNGIDDDQNGYIDDIHGWDFANDDNNPMDDHGHGTHVAGTIAAEVNNGVGIAGVAPRSRIMALKGIGTVGGSDSDLAQAIVYAANNGARVINCSWGGGPMSIPQVIADAINYAHDVHNAVVVVAAGNSNLDVGNEAFGFFPANSRNVITVAASDHSDQKAYFSNFGEKIDLIAPGGGDSQPTTAFDPHRTILSLKSSQANSTMTGNGALIIGGQYVRQAGTSMAAPHVAGAAALILSRYPTLSAEQVRQALRKGSDDRGATGFDFFMGYGRLNAQQSATLAAPLEARLEPLPPSIVAGSHIEIRGTARGSGFGSWRIEYGAGELPTSWTTITTGSSQISSGLFVDWNLNSVPDGVYAVRLLAFSAQGVAYEDRGIVSVSQVMLTAPVEARGSVFRTGSTITLQGTVNPTNFVSYSVKVYEDRAGTVEIPNALISLPGGGTSRIVEGTLATWNTTGISNGQHLIELTVNLTGGAQTKRSVVVGIDSSLHSGWPRLLGALYTTIDAYEHLTSADVDGDGLEDLLYGRGPTIYVVNHQGQNLPGWPQPAGSGGESLTSPVVGDVDGDGIPEVVASNKAGDLFVWRRNGALLASWPAAPGASVSRLALDDLNGDNRKEIIVVGWTPATECGFAGVFGFNGTPLPGWPKTMCGTVAMNQPAIADLNSDGQKEIVLSTAFSNLALNVFDLQGNSLPGWPQALTVSSLAISDVDANGTSEIVTWGGGALRAFRSDGVEIQNNMWPKVSQVPLGGTSGSFAIGDINGDGQQEYVALNLDLQGSNSSILVWGNSYQTLSGWPVTLSGSGKFEAPALADVDGDGKADIVISGPATQSAYSVLAYKYNGTSIPGFPKVMGFRRLEAMGQYALVNAPAIADFDGDAKYEIAWVDDDMNMFMWDTDAAASGPRPWPMVHRNSGATRSGATLGQPTATPTPAPTLPPLPNAPSNLSVTPLAPTQNTISWKDNSSNESGFLLERRMNVLGCGGEAAPFELVATTGPKNGSGTSKFYLDATVATGAGYCYRVRAYNAGGSSAYSNVVCAATKAAGTYTWQNQSNAYDVDKNGVVNEADWALVNDRLGTSLGLPTSGSPPPYYDVNGSNSLTATDFNVIRNYLNGQ